MAAQTPQTNQSVNQNSNAQVAGATLVNVDQQGVNTVQQTTIYYVKFMLFMYEGEGQTTTTTLNASASGINLLNYICVHESQTTAGTWTVIKKGNSSGGIVLPIAEVGKYRVYIREPRTDFEDGDNFTIPYHALDDGTESTRAVQPFFAIDVTEGTGNTAFVVTKEFPVTYTNRIGTITRATTLYYPQVGTTHNITSQHVTTRNALSLGNHIISNQLWGDASQAYGIDNTYIQNSTWSTQLESIYSGDFEDEPTTGYPADQRLNNTRVNAAGVTVMLYGRVLVFDDNGTERKMIFQNNSTVQARKINGFDNDTRMGCEEAIRRTHPCVFEYWLQTMHDLDITSANITSTWRPNLGSLLHRYSVGLDIGKLTANVVTNTTTNQTTAVTIDIKRSKNYNQNPANVTNVNTRREVELARRFFAYIGEDTITTDSQNSPVELGWLGCPWAFTYNDFSIATTNATNYRGLAVQAGSNCISTNNTHADHLHISLYPQVS